MLNAAFYQNNRRCFAEEMCDNSVAVIYSGREVPIGVDAKYPFIVEKNFRYLTGLAEPDLSLMAVKRRGEVEFTLFIEETDDYRMLYEGPRLDKKGAARISGLPEEAVIETVQLAALNTALPRLFRTGAVHVLYLDFYRRDFVRPSSLSEEMADMVSRSFPHISVQNCYPIAAQLRLIKTPEEIECIKKAIRVTGDGLGYMRQACRTGMMEYEWRAAFEYEVARQGCKLGFDSIVAQGINATYLHYARCDSIVEDGAMLLLDVGAEVEGYSADISRTYPANGVFTSRQSELYDFLLKAVDLVHSHMVNGAPYSAHYDALSDYYRNNLPQLGLANTESMIQSHLKQHSRGCCHHLGLDTHDGYFTGPEILRPGMVFTNEPGLYLPEEKIGIRLEEDLLITESGNELLSDFIPIKPGDLML